MLWVSDKLIMTKATALYDDMHEDDPASLDAFIATRGWLQKFRNHNGLSFRRIILSSHFLSAVFDWISKLKRPHKILILGSYIPLSGILEIDIYSELPVTKTSTRSWKLFLNRQEVPISTSSNYQEPTLIKVF